MRECRICPRDCARNRCQGDTGFCGETNQIRIARAALHFWEEPFISGEKGSGAIFFTGCNLKCIFCQNAQIALSAQGKVIAVQELADIMLDLEAQGAHNINLVTPSHVVLQVREALLLARKKGLRVPIVYNTSAYECVETLRLLDGLVDIYLPDFKYKDSELAAKYSHAPDYPEVAAKAIAEMFRQRGPLVHGENGMLQSGVVVRHLLLPLGVRNAKAVLDELKETYGDDIYISIMNQFTPVRKIDQYPHLNRKVTKREYENVLSYILEKGMENVFFQEGETAKESFIPDVNQFVE
ncbi:MAG: radical SAM protein [Lachnospiraceae bacterium]|nr:radical SAM protein [Lachnospiraceae bacterium]